MGATVSVDIDDSNSECKGGRIGIYNPAQRKALLAKFAAKRKRRVYGKAVRYRCRKNLANNRVRVKGRFVKQQPAAAAAALPAAVATPIPAAVATPTTPTIA